MNRNANAPVLIIPKADCPVCMEEFNLMDRVPMIYGECCHSVCVTCLVQVRNGCPLCRGQPAPNQRRNIALIDFMQMVGMRIAQQPAPNVNEIFDDFVDNEERIADLEAGYELELQEQNEAATAELWEAAQRHREVEMASLSRLARAEANLAMANEQMDLQNQQIDALRRVVNQQEQSAAKALRDLVDMTNDLRDSRQIITRVANGEISLKAIVEAPKTKRLATNEPKISREKILARQLKREKKERKEDLKMIRKYF